MAEARVKKKTKRPYTDAEREYLCRAYKAGMHINDIARELGRTPRAIQVYAGREKIRRDPSRRATYRPACNHKGGPKGMPVIIRYDDGRVRRFPTLAIAASVLGADLYNYRRRSGGYSRRLGFRVMPDTPENAAYGKEYRAHPGIDCMDWPKCLQGLPGAPSRVTPIKINR